MRGNSGLTLVELTVSIILTAVMLGAIGTVSLSSKKSSGKSDRQLIATQASQALLDHLRNYVTADNTTDMGPNKLRAGAQSWNIHSPTSNPPITDSAGDVYALADGCHGLTGFLESRVPGWFLAAPYAPVTLQYCVDRPVADTVADGAMPHVVVTLDWNEPL